MRESTAHRFSLQQVYIKQLTQCGVPQEHYTST
ncbi:hypothetical protein LCGC14_1113110 [marine sediment metagenome]|uniref:Uncharacterized protein n=1 Tax=marine sediment metagenome TaxID=412755 RepID=A0A0F9M655_9ZZZZ